MSGFWLKVDRRGPDECWLWQGFVRRQGAGYGQLEKNTLAHRRAYELAVGPIPAGLVVRHSCDVPRCCNPAHLSLGTPADNAADAVARRRTAAGGRNGRATLVDEQFAEILRRAASGETIASIARDMGANYWTTYTYWRRHRHEVAA